MRDLDTGVLTALVQDEIRIAVLAEFDFESGIERLWAGPEGYALEYDSEVWTSLADLGQIDKISEAQGLADARTTVTLRLNSEAIDEIGTDDSRGRDAKLILLLLDPDCDPIGPVEFRKTMGGIGVQAAARDDDDGSRIIDEVLSLELLDETATLNRAHFVRMTYQAGLQIDATDHGLEYVADPTIGDLGPVHDGRTFFDQRGFWSGEGGGYDGSRMDR
jgi:hypothetical protein